MLKRIVITAIMILIAIVTFAQEGLTIDRFFDDAYQSQSGITSVNISGDQLKQWKCDISLYRSITVENNMTEAEEMERAVKKDGVHATSRTVSMTNGHIYFGYYALPPVKGKNRFIIFMRSRDKENPANVNSTRTDLFYIEGETSPEQLSDMLRSIKIKK